jgi:hypothetical protein
MTGAPACPACGGPLVTPATGRRPVWCSTACRQRAHKARAAADRYAADADWARGQVAAAVAEVGTFARQLAAAWQQVPAPGAPGEHGQAVAGAPAWETAIAAAAARLEHAARHAATLAGQHARYADGCRAARATAGLRHPEASTSSSDETPGGSVAPEQLAAAATEPGVLDAGTLPDAAEDITATATAHPATLATASPPAGQPADRAPAPDSRQDQAEDQAVSRRDAGLGPGWEGWTAGTSGYGSLAVLYFPDGTIAGTAEPAGLGSSRWEARPRAGGPPSGGPWTSRRKALAALAAHAERRRRENTPGRRIPLARDGWYLDQTLAGQDDGRYTLRRPDGTVAGTVRRSPVRGHWDASSGNPDSALGLIPLNSRPGENGATAAGDWNTRDAAANAVIRWLDDY